MAKITLPSGSEVTTFPAPPVGFNILSADAGRLQSYGLPLESALHPELTQSFQRAMSTPTHFVEPIFKRNPGKRHGPARLRRTDAGEDSPNWSGAVVTLADGTTFNSATAQWNVTDPRSPSINGTSAYCSSWIGIDGYESNDVFQAGVECDVVNAAGIAQSHIYPWWEWYPESEVQIQNLPISAGDELYCLLTVVSDTTGNILLKNMTSGLAVNFQVTAPTGVSLAGNSTEWIVEAPGIDDAQSLLDNYGVIDFSYCSATTSGGSILGPEDGTVLDMNQNGQIVSRAVSLTPGSLTCTYTGAVALP